MRLANSSRSVQLSVMHTSIRNHGRTLALLSLLTVTTHAQSLPEIVAHRGYSAKAPENTLAAFNLAWESGADACELDLRLTAGDVTSQNSYTTTIAEP